MNLVLHFGHRPEVPARSSLIFRTEAHSEHVNRIVMSPLPLFRARKTELYDRFFQKA